MEKSINSLILLTLKKNLDVERKYTESVMKFLEYELEQRNMKFGYPKLNIIKKVFYII
jgi:hypothetical protein